MVKQEELVCPPPTTGHPVAPPYLAGWTPTSMRTLRAILRCKFHSSMALAMIRPLRKRKLVSRKYWGQTLLEGRMPMKGKRMMGRRAVTDRGRASVHQYTAISRMIYRQRPSCVGDGTNTLSVTRGQARGAVAGAGTPRFILRGQIISLNYRIGKPSLCTADAVGGI